MFTVLNQIKSASCFPDNTEISINIIMSLFDDTPWRLVDMSVRSFYCRQSFLFGSN